MPQDTVVLGKSVVRESDIPVIQHLLDVWILACSDLVPLCLIWYENEFKTMFTLISGILTKDALKLP